MRRVKDSHTRAALHLFTSPQSIPYFFYLPSLRAASVSRNTHPEVSGWPLNILANHPKSETLTRVIAAVTTPPGGNRWDKLIACLSALPPN
jgi:hypothetical protein